MDLQAVLTQVEAWTVEDRLRLMDEIWTGLLDEGYEPGLTDAQHAEVERRLAEDGAAPDDVVSWEQVKAEALARARS